MSKIGYTKSRIIDLISKGNRTLTDISATLKLHPATVSQHLQELREMGAITAVKNDHIKKWKYYQLNPEFDSSRFDEVQKRSYSRSILSMMAVLAILGLLSAIAGVALGIVGLHSHRRRADSLSPLTASSTMSEGTPLKKLVPCSVLICSLNDFSVNPFLSAR